MDWLIDFTGPIWDMLNRKIFMISGSPITAFSFVMLIFALIASVMIGKWSRSLISRLILSRGAETQKGLAYSVGTMVQYAVTISGILFSLDNVGISLRALAAFGAILTVGIGFGLQNIAQNFISGIILLIERPVQKGDFIIVGETVGTVDSISMRATRVISRDNVAIIVPNSKLITEAVVNQSAAEGTYRTRVSVGVAYGSETALVQEVLLEVAEANAAVLDTPPPRVIFLDFGESSLKFELVFWILDPGPEPIVTSEIRFAIDAAFRQKGIKIPFPQMDLHMQSGWNRTPEIQTEV